MTLTYETENEAREVVECTVEPYDNWGMFTDEGNKRITAIAQDAMNALESALSKNGSISSNERRQILVAYLVEWLRLGDTKKHIEARDTEVREVVGDFHDKLYAAAGGDYFEAVEAWDCHLEEAYKRLRK